MTTVEDQMMTRIARDMARDIDWSMLAEFAIQDGWTEVVLADSWRYNREELDQWARDNCKGPHTGHRDRWLFKQAPDATWFSLRWSA